MIRYFLIIGLLTIGNLLMSQEIEVDPDRSAINPVNVGYYQQPTLTEEGLLLTDEKYERLFLFYDGLKSPKIILEKKADYKNFNITNDRQRLGLLLDENNEKMPAIFVLKDKKLLKIAKPLKRYTTPSISGNKLLCFANDSLLIISNGKENSEKVFNNRIDKAIISSDGKHIAVATIDGKISVYDIEKDESKLIINEGIGINPLWSPDSQKLLYSNGIDLIVWDKRCNEKYFVSNGSSPSWSIDSEYIIYQKNNPIKMKFVNADIFLSKFNGTEHHQLTKTYNRYEMQPIFGIDNDIYFTTYEDRQLIRAQLKEGSFKIEKEEVMLQVK